MERFSFNCDDDLRKIKRKKSKIRNFQGDTFFDEAQRRRKNEKIRRRNRKSSINLKNYWLAD